ncbi:hypothetical protein BDK51DRAFT_49682 [Blyttiomyces helicus]|uniref:Uncharacterized protein n=1 Tax=Blyttiomyces helicus TaxID=388810 RepID=A0A4P9VZU5_9FUNG|nr:hypothetical protein BDK51DRAFT_49682 [Blyttiomyces helicus]|eukprot:RKO83928.1 hypothetical protein BDK51DRAFT_49682 [Blyttiomyces helicus]
MIDLDALRKKIVKALEDEVEAEDEAFSARQTPHSEKSVALSAEVAYPESSRPSSGPVPLTPQAPGTSERASQSPRPSKEQSQSSSPRSGPKSILKNGPRRSLLPRPTGADRTTFPTASPAQNISSPESPVDVSLSSHAPAPAKTSPSTNSSAPNG